MQVFSDVQQPFLRHIEHAGDGCDVSRFGVFPGEGDTRREESQAAGRRGEFLLRGFVMKRQMGTEIKDIFLCNACRHLLAGTGRTTQSFAQHILLEPCFDVLKAETSYGLHRRDSPAVNAETTAMSYASSG